MHQTFKIQQTISVKKVSNYLTPLEVDQSVIIEELLYLYAETGGARVNVDVHLKGSL